jgi:hypothetical protein
MTDITKDYVEEYLKLADMLEDMEYDIEKKAEKVLIWYVKNIEKKFIKTSNISFDSIDKDYIYYDQYFCGEADTYQIPIKFLTTSDDELKKLAEKYLKEREKEKELQKKIKMKEERRKKEKQEEEERKLYLELKKKYEK